MAWPFSNVVAPSLDTGLVSVPTSASLITAATNTPAWLLGAHFDNPTNDPIAVALTDGSDVAILPAIIVPPNGVVTFEWAFMPVTGLKWSAPSGLKGKVWGYV